MLRPTTALLALALLAGCLSPASEDAPRPPAGAAQGDAASPGGPGAPVANETVAAPVEPTTLTLHLTSDHGLSLTAPADAGTAPATENFFDPRTQLVSTPSKPWTAAGALPTAWLVTAAKLDVWFHSDAPQASKEDVAGFGPVVLFFGQDGAYGAYMEFDAPSSLAPGQTAHAEGDVLLPAGGLVYEAGAMPSLYLFFVYDQNDGTPILVHTGGEEASRVTLTVVPYASPGPLKTREETHTGEFLFKSMLADSPDPNDQSRDFPVAVNATTVRLAITVEGTTTAAHQDLDLALFTPTGERLWAASTPFARETLLVHDVNLKTGGVGDYVVRVVNGQTVKGGFTLTIRAFDVV